MSRSPARTRSRWTAKSWTSTSSGSNSASEAHVDLDYTPEEDAFRQQVARMDCGQRPDGRRAPQSRRAARLAAAAARRGLPRRRLAAGARRRAAVADAAGDPQRGAGARQRAGTDQRDGHLVGGPGDHPLRHRRAAAALSRADSRRRRDLGDRLLRAGFGKRHGRGEVPRRARRRLLRRQRPEGVDDAGAHLRLVLHPRAHLDRGAEVGRPHAAAHRHDSRPASR